MSFAAALAMASSRPADPDALVDLAEEALADGEEQRALPLLEAALRQHPSARLWQWKGLLERALDEHEQAFASFAEAARLDPLDSSIAHGHARIALEAGIPAEQLYDQAIRLAPADGERLLGLAAARLAAGRGEQAEQELDAVLQRAPLWIQGHLQLAQLRSMLGRPGASTASLERALATLPQEPQIWRVLFDVHVKRGDFSSLDAALERALKSGISLEVRRPYEAIAAAELGRADDADTLFGELDSQDGPALPIWRIRHLLRTGRMTRARRLIDAETASERAAEAWPYAALAWRLSADPRSEWLEGDRRLVWETDLSNELPPLDRLAGLLRSLHVAKGEYLDQSVRGGTQTDGPLFSRIEPDMRELRSAVVTAVDRYLAQLPEPDTKHPLLSRRRDRMPRFSGSWSVRLRDAGYHASHVHPQGWISSALYVALPPVDANADPQAGWLTMGEPPPGLPLDLRATRRVEPRPGKLVLFPSWMWHGTVPFPAGERLTVAFDVAIPR
ncbi:MAG TPA: putative 2OG-Fe(II) oxygenase [Sphingomicrobium sp.]